MVLDIVILVVLVGFTVYGYASGLVRSLNALALPVLGVWLGFRHYPALAPVLDQAVNCYPASALFSFLIIIGLTCLGLRFVHRLLLKLVDWRSLEDVDSFLGGLFGLVKGITLTAVVVVVVVVVVPSGRRLVCGSAASSRLLDLTEQVVGRRIESLRLGATIPDMNVSMSELREAIGSVRKTMEMLRSMESPYGPGLDE
uniref:CvpA family protein n=1 Tax=candidate division WOR-3 bacterium TaxID=2052148 RepID=A0A7C4CD85_UNCW3